MKGVQENILVCVLLFYLQNKPHLYWFKVLIRQQ